MDRFLYVAMSGARETLKAQAANNHNLANVSTTGFRADLAAFQARAVEGAGYDSRVYATASSPGWDATSGALRDTGRDLDVAVRGEGWIAVQDADGREAYTRAGDLHIGVDGLVTNGTGRVVLGDSGPLVVPPHASLLIGADGSISIVPLSQGPETTALVGRIKLVNPPADTLVRGSDGLFRSKDGAEAPADAAVQIGSGMLETSNVNAADAMVNMIELSRRFDLQVKAIRAAEDNGASSAQLLRSR
ncbi:MAG: flagellar basal body rod protein FlgF [Steroidobacteraceae bacterium]|nr:flagellar basal body rod protein FlgF [Steroidobacteraceae bacterium]